MGLMASLHALSGAEGALATLPGHLPTLPGGSSSRPGGGRPCLRHRTTPGTKARWRAPALWEIRKPAGCLTANGWEVGDLSYQAPVSGGRGEEQLLLGAVVVVADREIEVQAVVVVQVAGPIQAPAGGVFELPLADGVQD